MQLSLHVQFSKENCCQEIHQMLLNLPAYFTITGPEGSGIWKVTLDSQGAGGPHTITATSRVDNVTVTITLEDVLFGDVWVCSGQSNMQFAVSQVLATYIMY